MAKALVLFGSTTGNTEYTAETIAKNLKNRGIEVELKNAADADVGELSCDYDALLFGSSTWGDDEIELQEDFASFLESMDGVSLSGKKVGVFGCGDSSYTYFCGAVDVIEEKAGELGGDVVVTSLKIDGDPGDVLTEIQDWADSIAGRIAG